MKYEQRFISPENKSGCFKDVILLYLILNKKAHKIY